MIQPIEPGRRSGTRRNRTTIAEVARHADVSIGTVSNTLNHPHRVLASTRDRVWKSIDELGYVPSQAARLLSGAPSRTLGLVLPDIQSPFFTALAHAVEKPARAAGYSLLLCNSENEAAHELRILDNLASLQAHGALISPAGDTEAIDVEPPLPVVYLDHAGTDGGCAVLVDHHQGGRVAAQHLLDLGHETIGFVHGYPELWQFEQRLGGIREALVDAGLDPEKHLVTVASLGIGVDSGIQSARKLIDGGLPSAICCGNDMLAFGVHRGLSQQGIKVPDDVSLVGYDDILFAADWICPLTTIAQPMDVMGSLAGQLLVEHALDEPSHEHRTVMLEPSLVVRESTAAPTRSSAG